MSNNDETEGDIKTNIKNAKKEWTDFVEKAKEERENHLIDLCQGSYVEQNDDEGKIRKKIAKK